MKRINKNTNRPFKYGDIREDGFIFVDYRKTRPLKKDGHYQENWLSPNNFETRRKYSILSKKDWRDKRLEYSKKYSKMHAKLNPEQYAAKTAKRRAAKLQRTPKWDLDAHLIQAKYQLANMLTRETGKPYHVDHIIPLQGKKVCGLHVFSNLRVILGEENVKKSNKFLI